MEMAPDQTLRLTTAPNSLISYPKRIEQSSTKITTFTWVCVHGLRIQINQFNPLSHPTFNLSKKKPSTLITPQVWGPCETPLPLPTPSPLGSELLAGLKLNFED